MRGWRPLTVAFAFLVVPAVELAVGGNTTSESRVWVLDSGAKKLVYLALPEGERLAVLPLEGTPESLFQSPDGSRLIVLDRGPGKDRGSRGYEAKDRSVATIVDPASHAIVAHVDLGAGVDARNHFFSSDAHRLSLLCPGFEDSNPAKSLPRELVNVDLRSGVETGRVTLEHGTVPIGTYGRNLTLMRGLYPGSAIPFGQGRFSIVDLDGPALAGTVSTGGWFDLAMSGPYAYLLHKGWPDLDAPRHRRGSLYVYSVERRALETVLDAGNNPKGLFRDVHRGQLFIPGDAPRDAQDDMAGSLYIVRGSTLAATLDVAANPRMVTRAGETVFVVGEDAVTLVDPVTLEVVATIPLRNEEGTLVDDDELATELRLNAGGERAFILYGLHNKVVVLDLIANRALRSVKTGRKNKELLRGISAAFLVAGWSPGWQGDVLTAAGLGIGLWNNYLESGKTTTPSMLALHPDGLVAYAVNSQGRNVTVIDAVKAERVKQLGVRGRELRLLPGGHVLAVLSRSGIQLMDTTTNTKLEELDVRELRAFELTPDGANAVALGKESLLCFDASSGEVLARVTNLEAPVALTFDSAPRGQE